MIQQKCVATRQPWAQWRCRGDDDVLRRDCLCEIDDAHPPLLSLSASASLSSPFDVIVATITDVVLVAPAAVALAAFVVALAVVATTFLVVEVALVVDCCVPSPPEETIVSLLPRGRFCHGPRCPSSLRHHSSLRLPSFCRSHCPHYCDRIC